MQDKCKTFYRIKTKNKIKIIYVNTSYNQNNCLQKIFRRSPLLEVT